MKLTARRRAGGRITGPGYVQIVNFDKTMESESDLHAVGGIPVNVERFRAGGLGAQEDGLHADEQHYGETGGGSKPRQDQTALLY